MLWCFSKAKQIKTDMTPKTEHLILWKTKYPIQPSQDESIHNMWKGPDPMRWEKAKSSFFFSQGSQRCKRFWNQVRLPLFWWLLLSGIYVRLINGSWRYNIYSKISSRSQSSWDIVKCSHMKSRLNNLAIPFSVKCNRCIFRVWVNRHGKEGGKKKEGKNLNM